MKKEKKNGRNRDRASLIINLFREFYDNSSFCVVWSCFCYAVYAFKCFFNSSFAM